MRLSQKPQNKKNFIQITLIGKLVLLSVPFYNVFNEGILFKYLKHRAADHARPETGPASIPPAAQAFFHFECIQLLWKGKIYEKT